MLKERTQKIRYFLFSQYLADGIRVTLEIILPAIVCAEFRNLESGITISLGALCVSISDAPGPVEHKKNGMLYCNICIFIMALLTGFLNGNIFTLGLLILFSTFFFSMLTVFGNRANSIGTATLLILILRMTSLAPPFEVFTSSLLILSGGIWYMLVALLFYKLTPYRPAQRSLGDCIHETAKFLQIKAGLFSPGKVLEDEYRKLVEQQVIVSERQDAVRELLFKNRSLLKESTAQARQLVVTFVDVVDLYEQIMANWYDFDTLRKKFAGTGILDDVAAIVTKLADELDNAGQAIQSNILYKKQYDLLPDLGELKIKIDKVAESGTSNFMLKKILVNVRKLGKKVDEVYNYFSLEVAKEKAIRTPREYSRFVSHQEINPTLFLNNLTLESSVFRHALRMMITCGLGFTISKLISYGHHSYWILLTIVIILKPGFSLTKQRNFERFTGTLAGGILGLLLISSVHDRTVLFIFMVFFMIGTYTYVRLQYMMMVIFMTPYILLLFNFLGLGMLDIAGERLLDTAIASILAFLASYFLFPYWESKQLPGYMSGVLRANLDYLQRLAYILQGQKNSSLEYKLVRKELFVSTANLAAAFNRMLSEPKSKQHHAKEIYEFVVLNHVLSSNIAAVASGIAVERPILLQKEDCQAIKRSVKILQKSLDNLNENSSVETGNKIICREINENGSPDIQINEQLKFIYKVIVDIGKVTQAIAE
ncbi:MAG: FUSC family membrane protein [Ginsengibacter sp.]